MPTRELKPLMGPTITFSPEGMRPLQISHNDAFIIQIAIAMVCDIITLEFLKKSQYNEKDLEVIDAPIIGFGGKPPSVEEHKRRHLEPSYEVENLKNKVLRDALELLLMEWFLKVGDLVLRKMEAIEKGKNPRKAYTQLGGAIHDHRISTAWKVSPLNPSRGKDTKDIAL
ncbi:hypothetical protein Cgig2_015391 [Carnegiea gigantea]|uniref:Uncharacterized protein n=1 Tax=Carnegiea gigantea TaxID=171969 RepID=A0A9Q1GJK9_9CARY|nr:hypothetical protein Cgig2_015391 [Carnegiea gigantea]